MTNYEIEDKYAVLCVDALVFNKKNEILLARRSVEPEKGKWGLIGGKVSVLDDNLELAVIRRVKEETGLNVRLENLVGVIADAKMKPPADPRFYAVQIIYLARSEDDSPKISRVADKFRWLPLDKIKKEKLAFNHNYIVDFYQNNKDKLRPAKRSMFSEYFGMEYPYSQNDLVHFSAKAIVINKENKILLCHRKQSPFIDHWDFPGGHMYIDETVEDCLKRELKEELGVDCEAGDLFQVYSDKGKNPKFASAVGLYFVKLTSDNFVKNIEMDDFQYFSFNNLPEKIAYHFEGALSDIKEFLKL